MTVTPPRYAQPLLGRAMLLERIRRSVHTPGRIVSLVGPGGIGKTRLAAAVLEGTAGVFVPLGSVPDVGDVPVGVGEALGLDRVDDAEAAVAEALRARAVRLVVLDELERLLDAGPLLQRWVAACPEVAWLVTTRHPLRVPEEITVEVPPLGVPDLHDLDLSPAAALLRNAAPFPMDPAADPAATVAVLRLTAGLPLAIELAAARLALLPIEALRQRIDGRYFATLRDPERPERGLEAVLSDSWRQLSEPVRRSLSEATAFASAFAVADAEVVLDAGLDTLDHLHTLRAWHLLTRDDAGLRLLEPVRRFAVERVDRDALRAACRRHATWAAGAARRVIDTHGREPAGLDALQRLAPELRAVLSRAESGEVGADEGVIAADGLAELLVRRGPADRAIAIMRRGLALDAPTTEAGRVARARLSALLAQRLAAEGHPGALDAARAALDLAVGVPAREIGNVHVQLGGVLHMGGDLHGARRAFELAIELAGETAARLWASAELALVAHDQDRPDEAVRLLEGALEGARTSGDRQAESRIVEVAATIAVERRDLDDAERWNARFREISALFGDERKLGLSGLYTGEILEARGELEGAAEAFAAARALLVRAGAGMLVARADGLLGRIALVRGELDRAEALLPAWRGTWTATGTEADVLGAVLAALRADADAAGAHAAAAPDAPLAALAAAAARILAAPSDTLIDDRALADLGRLAAAVDDDPILIRLAGLLVDRAQARGAGWVLSADGGSARTPAGEHLDIGRSRANAAILAALADARRQGAGALDVEALAAAGWPGERLVEKSARSRVYVALSSLRKAGLEDLIVRTDAGWMLASDAPVFIEV